MFISSTGEDFGVGKRCVGFKGGRAGGFVFKDAWKTLHLKPETGLTFSNMVSAITQIQMSLMQFLPTKVLLTQGFISPRIMFQNDKKKIFLIACPGDHLNAI